VPQRTWRPDPGEPRSGPATPVGPAQQQRAGGWHEHRRHGQLQDVRRAGLRHSDRYGVGVAGAIRAGAGGAQSTSVRRPSSGWALRTTTATAREWNGWSVAVPLPRPGSPPATSSSRSTACPSTGHCNDRCARPAPPGDNVTLSWHSASGGDRTLTVTLADGPPPDICPDNAGRPVNSFAGGRDSGDTPRVPWHRGTDERRNGRCRAPSAGGSHVEGGVVEHPNAEDFVNAAALPADPTWFKHAVFYEVLVGRSTTPARTVRAIFVTYRAPGLPAVARMTAFGSPRSTTHRCATVATTFGTSTRCCPNSAPSTTSSH